LEDPLAQEFISWRSECESTIRSTFQRLSRGTPNLENETWNAAVAVIKGLESPEDAGARTFAPTLLGGPVQTYTQIYVDIECANDTRCTDLNSAEAP